MDAQHNAHEDMRPDVECQPEEGQQQEEEDQLPEILVHQVSLRVVCDVEVLSGHRPGAAVLARAGLGLEDGGGGAHGVGVEALDVQQLLVDGVEIESFAPHLQRGQSGGFRAGPEVG